MLSTNPSTLHPVPSKVYSAEYLQLVSMQGLLHVLDKFSQYGIFHTVNTNLKSVYSKPAIYQEGPIVRKIIGWKGSIFSRKIFFPGARFE
jgi:hypothetical protein